MSEGVGGRSLAQVIAVTSGKGGVGKTTVAVNLALLLAEQGHKTLIVDADLGLANVDVMLGLDAARHIGRLLVTDDPDEVAIEGPLGVSVISGGSGLRELAEADDRTRRLLLDKLRNYYRQFDYVVVDTSPGIDGSVTDFLKDARQVILVTTPEPTSLRDTYAATKTILRSVQGVDLNLVVNMSSSQEAAADTVNALNAVTAKFLDFRYTNWSWIAQDPAVRTAVARRQALARLYPRSPAAASLRRLSKNLCYKAVGGSLPLAKGGPSGLAYKA